MDVRPLRSIPRIALTAAAACALVGASGARAELTPWDQEQATALGEQLKQTTDALYATFYKQPPPTIGSGQSRSYERLKQLVRRIRSEARVFAEATAGGEGLEQTRPIFEQLMLEVRDAREEARRVFTTADVAEKAGEARAVLNRLGPYYDPDFVPLEAQSR